MADKMMAYLRSQPEIWRDLCAHSDALLEDFDEAMQGFSPARVLAIGSGSSYNAACCVQQMYAKELDMLLFPCVPTQAKTWLNLFSPEDTLVLLLSQSGESTSTIGVLGEVAARGFRSVALTQETGSTIAKGCGVTVAIACGEESVGPKTKGFTATVLMLQLMALRLLKRRGRSEAARTIGGQLARAFSLAGESIERSAAWAGAMSPRLCAAQHLLILAEGANRPAMLEGALKLLETLYVPAVSYEFEEYLHGVHCTIAEGSHLLLIVPEGKNRERMLRLAAFNEAHGGVSYVVSTGRPTGLADELFLETAGGDYDACYGVLLALQVVSALVSADKGINCDRPKFPAFNRELGTKNW